MSEAQLRLPENRAAQSTVDALVWVFRTEGVVGLRKPKNQVRLRECSPDQVREIITRLVYCRIKYPGRDPGITDALLLSLRSVL